ncbi:MAG: histidine kinase [Halomonadaceae bacterium]|nr:MAG: histidine kinase [Halomonadaceae bacterium]
MRLLVILLAWVLRRQLDARGLLEPDKWQQNLLAKAPGDDRGPRAVFLVVLVYIGLVLLAGLFSWGLGGVTGGLWASLAALLLLLLASGMPAWRQPLKAYGEAWARGDMQAAWHHVNHLLPVERRGESLAPERLHLILAQSLINATFERYFLPIFWYAVLGPAGLVLVVGALALSQHYPGNAVRRLFSQLVTVLAWLPARALSFSFGIAGDLSGWLHEQRRDQHVPGERRPAWLLRGASGALSSFALDPRRFERTHPEAWQDYGRRSLLAVRDLLNRSMLVWITALAVLAIMGWLP